MKNKQSVLLIILTILLITVVPCFAQTMGNRHHYGAQQERIKSMKIAFLTERLSLTPEEAQKFWPVYNQYQIELKDLRARYASEIWHGRKVSELTEEEATQYAECNIRRIEETAELKRNYHEKFLEILPVKKVALLYEAEKDFNRRLFREMRRRQRETRD